MKSNWILALILSCLPTLALAQTPDAPATPASPPAAPAQAPASYSVNTTTIGDLLASPAAKAVFEKYFPAMVSNPDLNQAAAMTLPQIQQYVPDMTNEKLAAMDADLKALPK